jgi:uncharacterized repeat protein (TIGR01451 family)
VRIRAALRVPLVAIAVMATVAALAVSASASVRTDGYDYAAGDTVSITGDGMQAQETVAVDVTFPDGSLAQHDEVTADDQGNFVDSYVLPTDAPAGIYGVTATGESSGAQFTTSFDPNGNGALNCPTLSGFNPTHYGLPAGSTVTCTIDGASEVSGSSTTDVIIKSSDLGNTTVTGAVTGTGSNTQITFTFDAPARGCNTTVVAYQSNGLNSNNSIITPGAHAAAGLAYLDGNGDPITCGDAASIDITKVADAHTISPGDAMGFTITVTSTGPGTANDVTVTDPMPTTLGTSWSIDGGTGAGLCAINSGIMTCLFDSMPNGMSQTVHLTSPTTAATMGDTTNTATVDTSNAGSDSASDTVHVFCPDVRLTVKADSATAPAHGSPVGFTMTLLGVHQGVSHDVTLTANLPKTYTWTIDPASSAGCSITAQVLSCSFGSLAQNATRFVHITSVSHKVGTITLKAVVNGSNMMGPVKRTAMITVT